MNAVERYDEAVRAERAQHPNYEICSVFVPCSWGEFWQINAARWNCGIEYDAETGTGRFYC